MDPQETWNAFVMHLPIAGMLQLYAMIPPIVKGLIYHNDIDINELLIEASQMHQYMADNVTDDNLRAIMVVAILLFALLHERKEAIVEAETCRKENNASSADGTEYIA